MKQSREERSRIMRSVKSRDTTPEMIVRSAVHRLGYRFRLCQKKLPGCPDLVFPRLRKVIFVHGCFWHGHDCSRGARIPRANRAYWRAKIKRNRERDSVCCAELTAQGWKTKVLWECELKDESRLSRRLHQFLSQRLPERIA